MLKLELRMKPEGLRASLRFACLVISVATLLALGLPRMLAAQTLSSAPTSADSSGHANAHELTIAAGDLLDVSIFDSVELSSKARVDPSGNLTLPVGGIVHVAGLTAEAAATAVEKRMRDEDIVKVPHVTVFVLEYATQGVSVLGEVNKPAVYPLLGSHGLLDLISAAGGSTPNAGKAVTITHRGDPSHPVTVQLESKPGSIENFNPDIEPGDTIVVARAGLVYVVGDVVKPGGFVIENNDRLTVIEAVALAQGINHTALLNSSKIIRKTATGREELPMPLSRILANKAPDVPLEDGDILFVPFSASKNIAYHGILSALQLATGVAIYHF
jgi:polysaccharide export outer membrane protein